MLKEIKDMTIVEISEEYKELYRFLYITCVLSANAVDWNGLNYSEAMKRYNDLSQQL